MRITYHCDACGEPFYRPPVDERYITGTLNIRTTFGANMGIGPCESCAEKITKAAWDEFNRIKEETNKRTI